jgi:anti-anti-sigma factor
LQLRSFSETNTPEAAPEPPGDAVPQLTVALVPAPDQVVVRLTGEGDLSTAALLTHALDRAAGHGTRCVVVDVSRACFWDCSGLHALADAAARLQADGRQCRIVGATAATRRLIAMAALAGALELDGPVVAAAAEPVRPRRRPASGHAATVRAQPAEEALGGRRRR